MKYLFPFIGWLAAVAAFTVVTTASAGEATTNAPVERIGVYDSRVVAYAHFCSDAYRQKIDDLSRGAKAARAAGDTNRFQKLAATLKQEQERNHLQVFSTASVEDVLAEMKERVAEIQKQAGVSRLVSRWDEATMRQHQGAETVDVTGQLLRDFKLDEKQKQVIESLKRQQPLPLEQARELMRDGKL